MTGRSLEQLIQAEARRYPQIAAMLEIVEHLTDEDIDTADVPLPWYRTALKRMRAHARTAAFTQKIEASMGEDMGQPAIAPMIIEGFVEPIKGVAGTYFGEDMFASVLNHKFQGQADWSNTIQVKENDLIFFPNAGGLWVKYTFSNYLDPRITQCVRNPQPMNLDEYKAECSNRLLALHPDAPLVATQGVENLGPMASLAMHGVRFS